MRVVVDEDLASRTLLDGLRKRLGEDAILKLDPGLTDDEVWDVAQQHRRAIVTQNARDFVPIAAAASGHAGLLLVSRQNDRAKDLTVNGIVDRLAMIDSIYADLTGFVLVVNGFEPLPG